MGGSVRRHAWFDSRVPRCCDGGVKKRMQQARTVVFRRSANILLLCGTVVGIAGCESSPLSAVGSGKGQVDADVRGIHAAERAAQPGGFTPQQDRTGTRVALAARAPVFWEDLQPALAEAAGAQALQELVIDRMLAAELRRLGLSVTPDEIARERNLVVEAISREAAATPDDTERLLVGVRRNRGLGPHRFERLLERTAKLRKLVAGEVEVTPDELRQAYEMRHGPRYRARAAVFATDRAAAEALEEVTGAPHELRGVRFAEIASRRSIDPSAQRGGLLEPISPADPVYPTAVRQTLPRMAVGDLSTVLGVDQGFAILLLEEILPGDQVSFEQAAPRLETDVRLRRERLLMDDLARRLIREANVSVLDRSLGWSWQNAVTPTP